MQRTRLLVRLIGQLERAMTIRQQYAFSALMELRHMELVVWLSLWLLVLATQHWQLQPLLLPTQLSPMTITPRLRLLATGAPLSTTMIPLTVLLQAAWLRHKVAQRPMCLVRYPFPALSHSRLLRTRTCFQAGQRQYASGAPTWLEMFRLTTTSLSRSLSMTLVAHLFLLRRVPLLAILSPMTQLIQ